MFGKSHAHNVLDFNDEILKTRHIFGFVCFLALKHFFIKIAMQRGAEDPEELFFPWSLTSHWNIIQQLFGGGRGGGDRVGDIAHFWPLCVCPLVMLPVGVLVFWGQRWPFLSSVGPAHGTVPPCFVLKLCGFSDGGTSDIQKGRGTAVPTTADGDFCGVHT